LRDIVAQLDITALNKRYRRGGTGRMAYDPRMLLLLWIYAAMNGIFSTRKIEAACRRDIGFMSIVGVGGQARVPDHTTLNRFISYDDTVVDELFAQVLRLCAALGMVRAGVVAIDGTKVAADASFAKSHTADALAHQLREAEAEVAAQQQALQVARGLRARQASIDEAEDAAEAARRRRGDDGDDGDGQGMTEELKSLARKLRGATERRDRIQAALDDLAARKAAAQEAMRAAQRAKQAAWDAKAAAAGTSARLGPRPRDEVAITRAGRDQAPRASVTDADSRRMKSSKAGFVQGYNVQYAVASDPGGVGDQIVLDARASQDGTDHHQLPESVDAVKATLDALRATTPANT
ncbi:Transposase, partial [Quadrisphaera granulorum]|uniref:transposase n=1 Tax=Quadrisphaera granulorum TaxID=317664 RepID=UPI000E91E984